MSFIPSQVADITVNWLNDVLPENVGKVDSFTITRFGTGVGILGELARLHLTYVDGAQAGPATIVAKCQSPAPENQFLAPAVSHLQSNGIMLRTPHGSPSTYGFLGCVN